MEGISFQMGPPGCNPRCNAAGLYGEVSMQYLSNNAGGRSSPTPESSQPKVTQTAQMCSGETAGTNYEKTVTPGQRYRFTAQLTGGFKFGLATVATGSEANIRWLCPLGKTVEIEIPHSYTVLHVTPDTSSAIGFLVELQ